MPMHTSVMPHSSTFPLGQVLATPSALIALEVAGHDAAVFLGRHLQGDWGELDPPDWQANDQALAHSGRILSVYTLRDGQQLWIITDADRSTTTLLLPDDA